MRYCGSKRRFMKHLLPILTEYIDAETTFIDLFGGGMNVIATIPTPHKIAVDNNKYVIALWKELQTDGMTNIPMDVSEEEYYAIKEDYVAHGGKYPDYLIGYVGAALSYGGAWFNGYAKYNPKKNENHVREAYNGLKKQVEDFIYLQETEFVWCDYTDIIYHKCWKNSNIVIYCDAPYFSTKSYESDFNHDTYWAWLRAAALSVKAVYISEYYMPSDFKCIWQQKKKDGMGTTKKGRKQSTKIEKLFVYGKD